MLGTHLSRLAPWACKTTWARDSTESCLLLICTVSQQWVFCSFRTYTSERTPNHLFSQSPSLGEPQTNEKANITMLKVLLWGGTRLYQGGKAPRSHISDPTHPGAPTRQP